MSATRALQQHTGEFRRRFRNHQYEVSPNGILFPQAQAIIRGVFTHGQKGLPQKEDWNLLPDQSLTNILAVYFGATDKHAAFYLALFNGAATPAANWTASNFAATAGEITSGTEGYSESTRPQWVPGTAASNLIGNSASKAEFTIATASQVTITGAALLTASAKGSTSGVLCSATRYASADVQNNGNTYTLGYTIGLTDS